MQNSEKPLVKAIVKFTDKSEKSQQENYYTMFTMKYRIKLLHVRIDKSLFIKKVTDQKN